MASCVKIARAVEGFLEDSVETTPRIGAILTILVGRYIKRCEEQGENLTVRDFVEEAQYESELGDISKNRLNLL